LWVGASAPTLSDHAYHLQSVEAEAAIHMICGMMRVYMFGAASLPKPRRKFRLASIERPAAGNPEDAAVAAFLLKINLAQIGGWAVRHGEAVEEGSRQEHRCRF